jgi:hypothetical protein
LLFFLTLIKKLFIEEKLFIWIIIFSGMYGQYLK